MKRREKKAKSGDRKRGNLCLSKQRSVSDKNNITAALTNVTQFFFWTVIITFFNVLNDEQPMTWPIIFFMFI